METASSGHTGQVFDHPVSEKVFPYVQAEFQEFQFVPIVCCPLTGHH